MAGYNSLYIRYRKRNREILYSVIIIRQSRLNVISKNIQVLVKGTELVIEMLRFIIIVADNRVDCGVY